MPHPKPALLELNAYASDLLSIFSEMQESVNALRLALDEKVPGFSASYEKHLSSVKKATANHPTRGQARARFQSHLEAVSQAIEELYNRR